MKSRPRIAIPLPHSLDPEYAQRAIPQYERAIELAGGEPVRILLDWNEAKVMRAMERCAGVLLPGSKADVDPAKFNAARSPQTAAADSPRESVDEILLDEAYRLRKPVLGICYGLQSLNVYRGGSLVQHIPDFLPEAARGKVNHEAGKTVAVAHTAGVDAQSRLGQIVAGDGKRTESGSTLAFPVNSSHHQSAASVGDGLRVVGRCPDDGIIEALEGMSADHFVIAVQWHPERSVDQDEPSGAIFRAFVEAAQQQFG